MDDLDEFSGYWKVDSPSNSGTMTLWEIHNGVVLETHSDSHPATPRYRIRVEPETNSLILVQLKSVNVFKGRYVFDSLGLHIELVDGPFTRILLIRLEDRPENFPQRYFDCPPFPQLTWWETAEMACWVGSDTLPAWSALQESATPNLLSQENPAEFGLTINSIDPANKRLPTLEQKAAYRFLLNNDQHISEAILNAAFDEYDWARMDCEEMLSPKDFALLTPDVKSARELVPLLQLSNINVVTDSADEFAYIGIALSCTWDDEHGLGVMTHRDRIVDFGQCDASWRPP